MITGRSGLQQAFENSQWNKNIVASNAHIHGILRAELSGVEENYELKHRCVGDRLLAQICCGGVDATTGFYGMLSPDKMVGDDP